MLIKLRLVPCRVILRHQHWEFVLSFGVTSLLLLGRHRVGRTGFSHISAHGLCQERLYSRIRSILGAMNRRGVLRHTDGESLDVGVRGLMTDGLNMTLCLVYAWK